MMYMKQKQNSNKKIYNVKIELNEKNENEWKMKQVKVTLNSMAANF